jgi:hypothetical protein
MSKMKVKSSSQPQPFKTGLRTAALEIDAVTNPKKRIISFSLTVDGKVKVFEVKNSKIQEAWKSMLTFILKNKLTRY